MKNLLFGILLLSSLCIQAQKQGPVSGQRFIAELLPGSSQSWVSTDNAAPSDDTYTNFGDITISGGYTDYIVATQFGFTIPASAIINGIFVEVERSDPNGNTSDYSIRIVKAKTISLTDLSTGIPYTTSDEYQAYGSTTELWGETWTPNDINNDNFGIAIAAQRTGAGSTAGEIDDIRITVFYSFNTLPVTLLNFNATKKGTTAELKWTTAQEINMDHYEVERSTNGRDFNFLANVNSRNQLIRASYTAMDNNLASGITYYRLKMVEVGGMVNYSRIVWLQSTTGNTVSVFPNPWKRGETLYISNPNREKLTIHFINEAGQELSKSVTTSSIINTTTASKFTGFMNYKVINESGERVGSGRLIIK